MIRSYMEAAMSRAHYEILEEDHSFYGEIPDCPGVYANAPALEACRRELEEVLEDWILFRVARQLLLPVI